MNTTDDPRLTAYALGEMSEAERAAFEAGLADSPAMKAAVDAEIESIRAAAAMLTNELHADLNVPATGPRLAKEEDRGRDARATKRRPHVARWVVAAAAAVIVAGMLLPVFPSANRALEVAKTGSAQDAALPSGFRHIDPPSAVEQHGQRFPVASVLNKTAEEESKLKTVTSANLPAVRNAASSATPPGKANAAAAAAGTPAATADAAADSAASVAAGAWKIQASGSFQAGSTTALEPALAPEQSDAAKDVFYEVKGDFRPGETARAKGELEGRFDRARSSSAESYAKITDNPFLDPRSSPLSTFGVDVDTGSYANVRRFLEAGQRPPADAVRIEELINYFPTHDAPPTDGRPFAVRMEVAACPWQPLHRLVRVGLKGKEIARDERPPTNLVFLVDVSGSMNEPNKLPLVKRSLRKLVGQLGENDRIAIVVYAGNSGLVLPSTNAGDKGVILAAIDKLEAGGSTNGGEGIQLAYATAMEHFSKSSSNRVILCTDGDFNVGVTDRGELFRLIAEKAKAGVFLNVLGFGTGNLKDDTMEGLADKGNGQYGYVDSDREADKLFVEQLAGSLVTIAKDVKLQLEFNPATVKSYRLIGYENRVMAAQDFNNDLKDSGEIGAGHNVVALYEIDPANGVPAPDPAKPELKYQSKPADDAARIVPPGANMTELLTLKLRYKDPNAPLEQGTSQLIETTLDDKPDASMASASEDFQFAASVAGFGMLLRESPYRGACSWEMVKSLAEGAIGADERGYRSEFLSLIDAARKARS